MTTELYNRIADELRNLLNREPTNGEIINSQNDLLIMMRVNDRIRTEENGIMQDQIDSLQTQVNTVSVSVDTLNRVVVS